MTGKRGIVDIVILVSVVAVALGGLYYAVTGVGQAGAVNFECNVECQPPKPVESRFFVTSSVQEAQQMCKAYANERCKLGTPYRAVAQPTGNFALPGATQYGGSIAGSSRDVAGRAFQLPRQNCYQCSCLDQGITSTSRIAASRVCTQNCGGSIVSERPGNC